MPFKFRLKRTRRYNVSSKNSFVFTVHLLDNSEIECTLTAENTGQEFLSSVAQRIEVNEVKFFGLRYVNKKLQVRWVDLEKPLKKQLDKYAHSPALYFGVMFYVANVHKIKDEITRYQYFLQLKNDIIDGRIPCTLDQAVLLASYSVQAEFGDHDYDRHTPEYLKDFVLLPRNMTTDERTLADLTAEVANAHRALQGLPPGVAGYHYIITVQQMEGYGLEHYPAKDDSGEELLIGACYTGVFVKHMNGQPTVYFKWSDIVDFSFSKRMLQIRTSLSGQTVQFLMDDPDTAKYVWKMCVLRHRFYKLSTVYTNPEKDILIDGGTQQQNLPDLQQSVQQHTSSQAMYEPVNPPPELTPVPSSSTINYLPTLPTEEFVHSQTSLEQQTPEPHYANGSALNIPRELEHSPDPLQTPGQPDGDPYAARRAALPSYRESPDYETLMRQRREQLMLEQQQQQQQQHVVANTTLALSNLGSAQIYSQPEMAYSQPEIRKPPSYSQYMSPTARYNNPSLYANAFIDNAGQIQYRTVDSRPVDRTSSLIIHPTYSTPELSQGLPNHMSTSENLLSEALYNQYKPPPPYPRPSSSTPDLASQTARVNISQSPDLVSRRHLNNTALMAQSHLDQSVENLTLDAIQLDLQEAPVQSQMEETSLLPIVNDIPLETTAHGDIAEGNIIAHGSTTTISVTHQPKPPPAMALHADLQPPAPVSPPPPQDVSPPLQLQPDPTLTPFLAALAQSAQAEDAIQDSDMKTEHQVAVVSIGEENDVAANEILVSTESEGSSSLVVRDAPVDPNMVYIENPEDVSSMYATDISQHRMSYITDLDEDGTMMVFAEDPNDPIDYDDNISLELEALPVDRDSSPEGPKGAALEPSGQQWSADNDLVPIEIGAGAPFGGSEPEPYRPPSSLVGLENTGFVLEDSDCETIECLDTTKFQETGSIVAHSKCSSLDTTSLVSSQMDQSIGRDETEPEYGTEEDDEDEEEDLKRLSMGPLKFAAMNGLSLSRGNIVLEEPSRAPKDERVRDLEGKLEEGQVFREFEQIPKKRTKCDIKASQHSENVKRNRFKDVCPYDDNRVKLKPSKQLNSQGYINASHIKYAVAKENWWYIAAQGPMEDTVADFWQMIWEQKVDVIAMLTALEEQGKPKCHRYWPEKQGPKHKVNYGQYSVILQFSNVSSAWTTSGFTVRHVPSGKEKLVWHLQYTDWPAHGCPEDLHSFLAYLDEIQSVYRHALMERGDDSSSPILVHCSAGVGRTGVVILTEIMKACLEHNENVEVPSVLTNLRLQRMYFVQTVGQYSFVYSILIQFLKDARLI